MQYFIYAFVQFIRKSMILNMLRNSFINNVTSASDKYNNNNYGRFRVLYCRLVKTVVLNGFLSVIMCFALFNHLLTIFNDKFISSTSGTDARENIDSFNNGRPSTLSYKDKNNKNILIPSLSYYYNKLNVIVEEFTIITEDGFPIEIWHLKNLSNEKNISTSNNNNNNKGKFPFLLMHGLLQSSGSFASGGEKSLAYYLLSQGYDVWLGNNRIGFEYDSIKNMSDENYWNWDMNEMFKFDLDSLIQFVKVKTNSEKINLIGHSQGTTEIFLALINNYNNIINSIDNVVALAPACYPGPLLLTDSIIMKLLSRTIDNELIFGNKSFIKMMMLTRRFFNGTTFFSFICYLFFNYLFEWNDKLWDKDSTARHFMFSPVYVSMKLMRWWLSQNPEQTSFIRDSATLFPEFESWFNKFENNKPNILLFVPKRDKLVDGTRLINHFLKYEDQSIFKYWVIDEYSHLDVLWATDITEKVCKPLVDNLR